MQHRLDMLIQCNLKTPRQQLAPMSAAVDRS
jgi:hypothetical protein